MTSGESDLACSARLNGLELRVLDLIIVFCKNYDEIASQLTNYSINKVTMKGLSDNGFIKKESSGESPACADVFCATARGIECWESYFCVDYDSFCEIEEIWFDDKVSIRIWFLNKTIKNYLFDCISSCEFSGDITSSDEFEAISDRCINRFLGRDVCAVELILPRNRGDIYERVVSDWLIKYSNKLRSKFRLF
jgi:hypothetical protein